MSGAPGIDVGELSFPGAGATEAVEAATAFRRELVQLWRADREAGLGWRTELGAVTLEIDPQLDARGTGEAMAREVRRHALDRGGGR